MRQFFAKIRETAVAGFFFLLPALIVVVVFVKAWTALSSLGSRVDAMFGIKPIMGVHGATIWSSLLLILIWIVCGLLVRLSVVNRFKGRVEGWISGVIPGYETFKRMAEEKLRNETTLLPYTSALIKVYEYWRPAYVVEQDSRDNYVVFLPDTPQTTQGRILLATKDQVRVIASVSANQLDSSLKKMGKGLLSELALADRQR
jgi:uncharacterized membrane protein